MAKKAKRADRKNDVRRAWELATSEAWPFAPEVRFIPGRLCRFDWALDRLRLAIEVEGVTNARQKPGRHQRPEGYDADCEKYNAAIEQGWVVLRYTQRRIKSMPVQVVEQIQRVMAMRERALYGRRAG